MSAHLLIDWTRCEGRGLCIELLPEVLTSDDWDYPISAHGDTSLAVPARAHRYAVEAVKSCPRLALRMVES